MKDDQPDFLRERVQRTAIYSSDNSLTSAAHGFLKESLRVQYSYNFDWLGMPVIQYPQDLVALQEIIWRTQPDLVIETGIARGGSLIFYASMLQLLGNGGLAVGIDVDLRAHNRARILAHPLSGNIRIIDGSSIDPEVIAGIKTLAEARKNVMIVLDSNHTHDHVLAELEAYTPLVSPGGYCVVFDTIIDLMPDGYYRDRPWNKGNSPATAVRAFLSRHGDWHEDREISERLLVSAAAGGYLRRSA